MAPCKPQASLSFASAGGRENTGMRHELRDLVPGPSRRTRLRRFAPITTHVINPVTRLFAGRLPGFGILGHIGRTTGRRYRTPLLVLRRGNDYVTGWADLAVVRRVA